MEKILLAIDAINPNKNTLDFACYLARLTKSKIAGVFLENVVGEERPLVKEMPGVADADWDVVDSREHEAKTELTEKNISFFKEGCTNREVNHRIHRDRGVPANEIIEETRFADLVVVDAQTSFNKRYEGSPSQFVKNVLEKAECPVVIAPESDEPVNEIIFTYNGSASSVFAIKQFTYLFPQLHDKKVSIVQVNEEGVWHDPEIYKFSEWLKDHYSNLHFEALKGKTDAMLFEFLLNRKGAFLVMGAYGRNALSRFFQGSHADLIIKTLAPPVFVAHL